MVDAGRPRSREHVHTLLALLAVALSTLAFASEPVVAQAPFEPNDSVLSAAGPLAIGQTYTAGIETPADRDYFFFYVTSTPPPQVMLTVENLGGGTATSGINAAIVDSLGNPIDPFAYAIGNGTKATASTTLEPQKYFVEVDPVEGSQGEIAYSLTTGGGSGAFGPYAEIAAPCAAAKAATGRSNAALEKAQGRLQRAIARVRQTLFGSHNARQRARATYQRAKDLVTARRNSLRAARRSQRPWCMIPR